MSKSKGNTILIVILVLFSFKVVRIVADRVQEKKAEDKYYTLEKQKNPITVKKAKTPSVFVTEKINDKDREVFSRMKGSLDNSLQHIPHELVGKVFAEDGQFSLMSHESMIYMSIGPMNGNGQYRISHDCTVRNFQASFRAASEDEKMIIQLYIHESEALDASNSRFGYLTRSSVVGEVEETESRGITQRDPKSLTITFSLPSQQVITAMPKTQLTLQASAEALKNIEQGVKDYHYFLYPSSPDESASLNLVTVERYVVKGSPRTAWLLKTVTLEYFDDDWLRTSYGLEVLSDTGVSLYESIFDSDSTFAEFIMTDLKYLEDDC